MKVCILMGSLRKNGNTAALIEPFIRKLEDLGNQTETVWLGDKNISSCVACCACQNVYDGFGCSIEDDMQAVFQLVMESDIIVLATPIYSWYCTAPMKAALDRLVYGMNKFYGDERRGALWKGKSMALITTCGYPVEKGADLFEEGIRRFCKHSKLNFLGSLKERDLGYDTPFIDEEKRKNAAAFGALLLEEKSM